jgi:hypothetical protein
VLLALLPNPQISHLRVQENGQPLPLNVLLDAILKAAKRQASESTNEPSVQSP